jgi:hypothetical protein
MHVSPLRFKLERLLRRFPSRGCLCVEDWLVDVANKRDARIVVRDDASGETFHAPPLSELPNEELVVAICHPNNRDRPQMLRLAAQLISRRAVAFKNLRLVAERERAGRVLAALAAEALRVAPQHELWRSLADAFCDEPPLREPLLHWTRLAQPVMKNGRYNAETWKLAA